jgi:tetratricopeptide (TPR) repeat protein
MKLLHQVLLCISLCMPGNLAARDSGDVLRHAISLMRANRPLEAEQALRAVLERDPGLADAQTLLGFLLLQRGGPQEAERFFRNELALRPETPAARLGLGIALAQQGLFQSAAVEFSRIAFDPSLGPRASAEHARNLFLMGREREAFDEARVLCEKYPLAAEPKAMMGFLFQTRGKTQAALDCYLRASSLAPRNLSYRFALITLNGDLRHWQEMLDATDAALELDSNHPLLYQSRALALDRLGRSEEAEAARTHAGRTYESEILFARALSADRAGRRRDAVGLLRRCVELNPGLAKAWSRLGEFLLQEKQCEQSRAAFLAALEADPEDVAARVGLASALHAEGRTAEALREYRRSLATGRVSPDLLAGLAATYMDQGRIHEAAAAMLDATRQLPDSPDLLAYLGYLQDAEGRSMDSAASFSEALNIDPGNTDALIGRAGHLLREGNRGAAAACLNRALERDPGRSDAWLLLIRAYREAHDDRSAETACRRCMEHSGSAAACREQLATLRMDASDYHESAQQFQSLLRSGIASKAILDGLAFSLTKLGDYPQSITIFRSSLERFGTDPWVYSSLGFAYRMQGDLNSAISCYRKAREMTPRDPDASYNLGYALHLAGDFAAAVEPLLASLRIKPDRGLAHYHLALTYWHLQQYGPALIQARMALENGVPQAAQAVAILSESLAPGAPRTIAVLRPKR